MKKSLLVAALAVVSFFNAADARAYKFGTEATFAPFEFTDDKSNIIGFDVDIIKAIGEVENIEFEVVNMPFDALVPSVLTRQLDGAISGITITEERAKTVAFSEPYYKSGISAVIRTADAEKFKTFDDLKKSRLCAQIGTTGAKTAADISGNVGAFNTVPEAFLELKAKGCDAVLNDRPVNLYFLTTKQDKSFAELSQLVNGEDYGIIVSKKNTELLEKINDGLSKIKQNGKYAEIHKKWFNVEK